jgi:hypothetical protein
MEGAKGCNFAPFLHPVLSIRGIFSCADFTIRPRLRDCDGVGFRGEDQREDGCLRRMFGGRDRRRVTSNVDRNEECRNNSCITLNSVPTLRSRVEYVCRKVCHPNRFWIPSLCATGRARAILTISATLGAINLSRAVSDPNLSREILKRTRDELISLNKEDGAEKRQETR